ncbi:DUF6223 family protein [Streptosporangium sp. DT93]|uniref:DUF6223 family protein n=1 Tax=Streptosporangium sp. DT93 TaxID=3393428 RepID=UPI003CEAAD23
MPARPSSRTPARMPVRGFARRPLATAAAALRGGMTLAAPGAAHVVLQVAVPDPVGASALSAGRLWSLVAALLGLAGVIAGVLALTRSAGRAGRRGAVPALAALVAGAAGAAVGALVVAAAKGGPGTGYGIVGGYAALAVGAAAVALGLLALNRSRRSRRAG